MNDYIKREDAINAIQNVSENYTGEGVKNYHPNIYFLVDELKYFVPSADVIEHKCGEWIQNFTKAKPTQRGGYLGFIKDGWSCSECGVYSCYRSNFCSNCGANMRGEE